MRARSLHWGTRTRNLQDHVCGIKTLQNWMGTQRSRFYDGLLEGCSCFFLTEITDFAYSRGSIARVDMRSRMD